MCINCIYTLIFAVFIKPVAIFMTTVSSCITMVFIRGQMFTWFLLFYLTVINKLL